MKNILHLFILLLCLKNVAYTQTTKVKGKIIDASTQEALPFVNVVFVGTNIGSISNENGEFEVSTIQKVDSLKVSFVGYFPQTKKVIRGKTQIINFELTPNTISLQAVEIKYKGNPAHDLLDKIVQNKSVNNPKYLEAIQYEVYNKLEFDVTNFKEKLKNSKAIKGFEFIFDYTDTTDSGDQFLPLFISETVSEIYQKEGAPPVKKEIIKANKISGIQNQSISQFMGDMYQNVNIYENYTTLFAKSFVSPINNNALLFYKFYLTDSLFIDNQWCYRLDFKPKRTGDLTFEGTMWVHDTTFAVKKIQGKLNSTANINFLNDFTFEQSFQLVDGKWVLSLEKFVGDFYYLESSLGFIGRKTTSYKNFKINQPLADNFYKIDKLKVLEDATEKDEEFWQTIRHQPLNKRELTIYQMVDSIKSVPRFRTYSDIINMLITGYYDVFDNTYFEYGPILQTISYNPIEGYRLRIGGKTTEKLFKHIRLSGHLAYETGLKDIKYRAEAIYFVKRNPRSFLQVFYENDYEQIAIGNNAYPFDHFYASANIPYIFRRRLPMNKLSEKYEAYIAYEHHWRDGISNRMSLSYKTMGAPGNLYFLKFTNNKENIFDTIRQINNLEVLLNTRIALSEKYVDIGFNRTTITGDYPTFAFTIATGIPNIFKSQFNYQKFIFNFYDRFSLKAFGYGDLFIEAGKLFGKAPYTLLFPHYGNDARYYDQQSFNLMNIFEFVSDQYVSAMFIHHFDGFFFNKIPLLKRLKWREVVAGKAVMGNVSDANKYFFAMPSYTYELKYPYMEASAGVENIFKFFRIDLVWRLNYLQHPNVSRLGIRSALQIMF